MIRIIQPLKFLAMFFFITSFIAISGAVSLILREHWRRTRVGVRILNKMARMILRVLGVRVNPIGIEAALQEGNALVVGNHVSYLDVIVISSRVTTSFVTSVEIKETPVLGQLCMGAGCLFVERRNKRQIHREIGELSEGLRRGVCITIFPEATSSNHEKILPFRRPLFLAAVQAQKPIVPMCINYRKVGDEDISIENRDKVCWYGSMPFVSHLWTVCGLPRIEVDLIFLPAIHPAPDAEAGDLAARTQAAVESVFRSVKSRGA